MATVTEITTSGEGDFLSAFGSTRTRVFRIVMRDAGDDINNPIAALNERVGFRVGDAPIGSPHPLDRTLKATRYRQVEREADSPDVWLVAVDYELPELTGVEWHPVYRSSSEVEDMLTDLDGKLVGTNAYRVPDDVQPITHQAQTIRHGGIDLIARSGVFNSKAIQRFKGVVGLQLSRMVPPLGGSRLRELIMSGAHVNDKPFRGAGPAEMLLLTWDAEPVADVSTTSNASRWRVTIEFLWKPDRWTPVRLFDRFESEGFESSVFLVNSLTGGGRENQAVFSDYKTYDAIDFDLLLANVAASGIRTLPGARP